MMPTNRRPAKIKDHITLQIDTEKWKHTNAFKTQKHPPFYYQIKHKSQTKIDFPNKK